MIYGRRFAVDPQPPRADRLSSRSRLASEQHERDTATQLRAHLERLQEVLPLEVQRVDSAHRWCRRIRLLLAGINAQEKAAVGSAFRRAGV